MLGVIYFSVQLNNNATDIVYKLKQADSEHALSSSQVFSGTKHLPRVCDDLADPLVNPLCESLGVNPLVLKPKTSKNIWQRR